MTTPAVTATDAQPGTAWQPRPYPPPRPFAGWRLPVAVRVTESPDAHEILCCRCGAVFAHDDAVSYADLHARAAAHGWESGEGHVSRCPDCKAGWWQPGDLDAMLVSDPLPDAAPEPAPADRVAAEPVPLAAAAFTVIEAIRVPPEELDAMSGCGDTAEVTHEDMPRPARSSTGEMNAVKVAAFDGKPGSEGEKPGEQADPDDPALDVAREGRAE